MLISSLATGLYVRTGIGDGVAVAALGSTWEYVGPVRIGDTIHMDIEAVENRQTTSNPKVGISTMKFTVYNQNNEIVQYGTFKSMKKWYRPKD